MAVVKKIEKNSWDQLLVSFTVRYEVVMARVILYRVTKRQF